MRSFVTAVNQLASKDTVCWLASQKYYFGLGGGTQSLIDTIKEEKLPLSVEIVETLGEDTVKRDIVCVRKLSSVCNKNESKRTQAKQPPAKMNCLPFRHSTFLRFHVSTFL